MIRTAVHKQFWNFTSSPSSQSIEGVLQPLCHRPRLDSKAEVDIVTQFAVCTSQDSARVDKIVVGNYVTASQAPRKWYTEVISKVSSGNDKLWHKFQKYVGGALCIFRLEPQDYHRFHSSVTGTVGPMTYITGEYHTVNVRPIASTPRVCLVDGECSWKPQAIRTALDVYGENVRKIVPIDSSQFGRVMCVCIGAMMVGSIHSTVQEGEQVNRGEELGYLALGGSTIVVLFEKGVVEWDEDLLTNGRACLETLVHVGMGVGCSKRKPGTYGISNISQ